MMPSHMVPKFGRESQGRDVQEPEKRNEDG